jgi:type I restriction-modification system DNA methylase subunit
MPSFTCSGCLKNFDHKGTYDRHINRKISCNEQADKDEKLNKVVKKMVKKELKKVVKNAVKKKKKRLPLKKGQKRLEVSDEPDEPEEPEISDVSEEPEEPDVSDVSDVSEDASSIISSTGVEIATREDLKEKIHEIHNFLRNNGVGYGMNALKVFNLFYGLARIEEKNLFKLIELNPECKFSTLLELSSAENLNHLPDKVSEFQRMLLESKVEQYILFEIPRYITYKTLAYLIKEINYLLRMEKTINMQIVGKVYEYFVGRDKTAISEMGAYFTDRHISEFIYNNVLDIELVDGQVPTMIDPFGGSGGFTIGYIQNLMTKYPEIDWSSNIDNVHHVDMNDDVVKYAGLEFMCLTGHPPKMDETLRCQNSFTYEYPQKYKYIITNPPYGGDKNKKSSAYHARQKIREYLINQIAKLDEDNDEELIEKKQDQLTSLKEQDKLEIQKFQNSKVSINTSSQMIKNYARTNKLLGNDKEAVSLIMMMCMIDQEGISVGVLKEGVFFDGKYSKLRKHLIENFNIISVTSVPSDQFENTSTKTSIIRFDNTGPTEQVEFYNMNVVKCEEDVYEEDSNGNIIISSMLGEIIDVKSDLTSKATIEQLGNNNWSLNGKEYKLDDVDVDDEVTVPDGYKLVKLGDLCTFMSKSKRKASYGKPEGKYPFYTSSDIVKYCDVADYTQPMLIIGDGGNFNIKMDNSFSCSDHNHLLTCNKNTMLFIYNYMKKSATMVNNLYTGSVIKNISVNKLKELQIPIPIDDNVLESIVAQISEPYEEKQQAESELSLLETSIKQRVADIIENEECTEHKLGDLCEIKTGKTKSSLIKNKGTMYPYYASAGIVDYVDHYLYDGKFILIARKGTIGNIFITNGKFYPGDNIFVLTIKNNIDYLNIYLLSIKKQIHEKSSGSIVLGIKLSDLKSIIVRIPKDIDILNDLQVDFDKIEQLKELINEKNIEYNNKVSELF